MIKNEQGFSFAELMTVIAIVGILSAIALPNFLRSLPEKRLKNAARNLYADLQRARLLAVKENRSVRVWFTPDNGTYHFENDSSDDPEYGNWNSDDELGRGLKEYGAVTYGCDTTNTNWADPPASIDGVTVSFSDNNFLFTSTGVIDDEDSDSTPDEGAVYLQSENDPAVCYAVEVTGFGAVKIRRFKGDWGEE